MKDFKNIIIIISIREYTIIILIGIKNISIEINRIFIICIRLIKEC